MSEQPHLMPLLQKDQMRVTITVAPTGVVGQTSVNVIPEHCGGGWEQVLEILLFGIKVSTQELAKTMLQQQQMPRIMLPGNGERH